MTESLRYYELSPGSSLATLAAQYRDEVLTPFAAKIAELERRLFSVRHKKGEWQVVRKEGAGTSGLFAEVADPLACPDFGAYAKEQRTDLGRHASVHLFSDGRGLLACHNLPSQFRYSCSPCGGSASGVRQTKGGHYIPSIFTGLSACAPERSAVSTPETRHAGGGAGVPSSSPSLIGA